MFLLHRTELITDAWAGSPFLLGGLCDRKSTFRRGEVLVLKQPLRGHRQMLFQLRSSSSSSRSSSSRVEVVVVVVIIVVAVVAVTIVVVVVVVIIVVVLVVVRSHLGTRCISFQLVLG